MIMTKFGYCTTSLVLATTIIMFAGIIIHPVNGQQIYPGIVAEKSFDYSKLSPALGPGELLCNCSHIGCGIEPTGELASICRTFGGCHMAKRRKESEDTIIIEYNCISQVNYNPPFRPIPCQNTPKFGYLFKFACCSNGSFCSQHLHLELNEEPWQEPSDTPPTTIDPPQSAKISGWKLAVFILLPLVTIGLAALILLYYCRNVERLLQLRGGGKHIPLMNNTNSSINNLGSHGGELLGLKHFDAQGMNVEDIGSLKRLLNDVDSDLTSGSGSGLPILEQRTVARQITKVRKVGEGRFGSVYLGRWKGDNVAVKIFESRDESSYNREVEIFNRNFLQHPNILTFYAADNMDAKDHFELWLVTEFHQHGSVFDYLQHQTVTVDVMCKMTRSIASGLAYLHSENVGTHCKPAIAHRDVKSKNILVKADGECCLADLGMAVHYSDGVLNLPDNGKVGTRRYCAPEILDESMNMTQMESFRRADVYSTGLTMWEICRRTEFDGVKVPHYELPYFDSVPSDPTVEEMRRCVCADRKRPPILNTWVNNKIMHGMYKLLRECWTENPSARLPPLRIKKTIDQLRQSQADHNQQQQQAGQQQQSCPPVPVAVVINNRFPHSHKSLTTMNNNNNHHHNHHHNNINSGALNHQDNDNYIGTTTAATTVQQPANPLENTSSVSSMPPSMPPSSTTIDDDDDYNYDYERIAGPKLNNINHKPPERRIHDQSLLPSSHRRSQSNDGQMDDKKTTTTTSDTGSSKPNYAESCRTILVDEQGEHQQLSTGGTIHPFKSCV